jgi:hypothetical protein
LLNSWRYVLFPIPIPNPIQTPTETPNKETHQREPSAKKMAKHEDSKVTYEFIARDWKTNEDKFVIQPAINKYYVDARRWYDNSVRFEIRRSYEEVQPEVITIPGSNLYVRELPNGKAVEQQQAMYYRATQLFSERWQFSPVTRVRLDDTVPKPAMSARMQAFIDKEL